MCHTVISQRASGPFSIMQPAVPMVSMPRHIQTCGDFILDSRGVVTICRKVVEHAPNNR